MKRPFVVLTLAVSALLTVPIRADLVTDRFSAYLDALRIQAGIPGLAATIVSGVDTEWEGALGQQDVEHNIAVRPDTPFEVDGLTQTLTASLALRCDESGWISLDDPVSKYAPTSPDASSTLRMLLTHTSLGPGGLVFSYNLARLAPLAPAISVCTEMTFPASMAGLLDRLGMADSVPGADAATAAGNAYGLAATSIARYAGVMGRLAVPYAVSGGHASPSTYGAPTLTPSTGLITTVRDLAKFDVALKSGVVMRSDTLTAAWTPPVGANGASLPHAEGWFVQGYNGEPIVWQFGEGGGASSMVMIAPRRALTLIMLANSAGLSQGFNLAAGDMNTSPFARLFLGLFVR